MTPDKTCSKRKRPLDGKNLMVKTAEKEGGGGEGGGGGDGDGLGLRPGILPLICV